MTQKFEIHQVDIPPGMERELERLHQLIDEGGDSERAWAMKRIEVIHDAMLTAMNIVSTYG